MHITTGNLRAYLDHELSEQERTRVESHVDSCQRCRKNLEEIEHYAMSSVSHLALLPTREHPPTNRQVSNALADMNRFIVEKENQSMFSKLKNYQIRIAAGAVMIAILALAFAFPQVRAIANNFLGIFRVEQVTVLPMDLSRLEASWGSAGVQFDRLLASQLVIEKSGESQTANSIEEAASLAGFNLRFPSSLPAPDKLVVDPAVEASYQINLARERELLEMMGQDPHLLPDHVDGQKVTAQLSTSVFAGYGSCAETDYDPDQAGNNSMESCLLLVQMPSPVVNAPQGLDLERLAAAFLKAAGMPAAEAEAFSQRVDWATTLVVPIPPQSKSRDVQVDGVQGVLVEPTYRSGPFVLIWVKDGILYGLSGTNTSTSPLNIANSMP
jgi:hypothetical protein